MDKTLVIMAAGMGSRYGSLKQIDPVGDDGSLIIDYSIHDAVKAGFNKIVFIIKEQDEEAFRDAIGNRIEKKIKTEYVYQDINNIPDGYSVPEGRVKPWGTGHAILSCLGTVKEPFAVINSDDFYGPQTFTEASEWIEKTDFNKEIMPVSMVGFRLKNTLTENGHVSRGVCVVNGNNQLDQITERTKIIRRDGKVYYEDNDTPVELDENSIVSMNCWCFPPQFIDTLQIRFNEFFKTVESNPLKSEFFLPFVVSDMLEEKVCTVDVLETNDKWFGVTYGEDKYSVKEEFVKLHANGTYAKTLY